MKAKDCGLVIELDNQLACHRLEGHGNEEAKTATTSLAWMAHDFSMKYLWLLQIGNTESPCEHGRPGEGLQKVQKRLRVGGDAQKKLIDAWNETDGDEFPVWSGRKGIYLDRVCKCRQDRKQENRWKREEFHDLISLD